MLSRYCKEGRVYLLSGGKESYIKDPLGPVYTNENIADLLAKIKDTWNREKFVSAVGDRVTFTLLNHGIVPDLAVIDEKEKRGKGPKINRDVFNKVFYAVNKKGTINMGLCRLIIEGLENSPSLIVIDGEEDLVGFPVVLSLPNGSLFIYGQPDVGMVAVEVNEYVKRAAESILDGLELLKGGSSI